jgi:hypothetical protein
MSMFDEFAESLSGKVSPTRLFPTAPATATVPVETVTIPVETPVKASPAPTTEPYFRVKSTEEVIDKLATAGAKGVSFARGLFEKIKHKMEQRDIEKLEKEIASLEEEKKKALEEAGLRAKKEALEKELVELKKPKLESVV